MKKDSNTGLLESYWGSFSSGFPPADEKTIKGIHLSFLAGAYSMYEIFARISQHDGDTDKGVEMLDLVKLEILNGLTFLEKPTANRKSH